MLLDIDHFHILSDIESFSGIKRYRGMMPNRLALFHANNKLDELLAAGLIERVSVDMPCGSESNLFKLTDQGQDTLERHRETDEGREFFIARKQKNDVELTRQQLVLLNDIYHLSQLHRNGGITPNEELADRNQEDLQKLYNEGLVLRVKSESGKNKKRKGLVLSRKGLHYL